MKRQITQLIDDLDGSVIDDDGETIRFALDGRDYEIDLSPANAQQLRAAFEPYIRAGRGVSGRATARPRGARSSRSRGSDLAAVRAWANENGYTVGDRGRIPAHIQEAYDAANR